MSSKPRKSAAGAPAASTYDDSALLGVYRPAAPVFVRAHGSTLYDERGRAYIDFASGIGVNALGYGDEGVAEALGLAVASGLVHLSNLYRTRPAAELAAELVRHSFANKVFFCNSGAEANEGAFKFARRWARQTGGPGKFEIVALQGAFHGRLFGSLAATDRPAFQQPFEPLMPGVKFTRRPRATPSPPRRRRPSSPSRSRARAAFILCRRRLRVCCASSRTRRTLC